MLIAKKDGVVFQLGLHREMWDFLSKNPTRSKNSWPGWKLQTALFHCFACEATMSKLKKTQCLNCPLCEYVWVQNTSSCLGGLYAKWVHAHGSIKTEEASKYAAEIRDLPLCNRWEISGN
jgi:hypothetical protein